MHILPELKHERTRNKDKRKESLLEPLKEYGPAHSLISDFWPLELGGHTFLFKAIRFVAICCESHRKLI